jgi:hypothetical protein
MSMVRDAGDEHQIRVDRMVEEFRKAQSRRLAKAITVKGDDHVVELQGDASGLRSTGVAWTEAGRPAPSLAAGIVTFERRPPDRIRRGH